MEDNIRYYSYVADVILSIVHEVTCSRGKCDFMLTGGRSANHLYRILSKKPEKLKNIVYYFGDERCVPHNSCHSNFGMATKSLFINGIPSSSRVEQINPELSNVNSEVKRYSLLLPISVDILLLSVGEDGHIASLFPYSDHLDEDKKKMLFVSDAPKYPKNRITISPLVINKSKNIIVLAAGKEKGVVLEKALKNSCMKELPVMLTIKKNTIWVLDHEASIYFKESGVVNNSDIRIVHA